MTKVIIKLVEYDTSEKLYGQGNLVHINPIKKHINIVVKGLFLKAEDIVKEIKKQLEIEG